MKIYILLVDYGDNSKVEYFEEVDSVWYSREAAEAEARAIMSHAAEYVTYRVTEHEVRM